MLKKTLSLLLIVVMILTMTLCLCSCKNDENAEYPVTIGNVTITSEPLNIVVLSDDFADIISYMGYDIKMVGRSIECDQEFLSIVPIIGTAQDPNVDSILAYETHLVIADNTLSDSAKSALAESNIPVISFEKPNSLEELKALYTSIGTVLGGNVTGKAQGENSYNELITTLSDFEGAIPNDIVKTACYLYIDENGSLCTLTSSTIKYELFNYCGAINAFSNQQEPQVDLEQLRISTPTFIFYDDEAVLDLLNENSELSSMSALKNANTYQVKLSDFERLGTSCEELIYHMIEFMFIEDEATPDEKATEQ